MDTFTQIDQDTCKNDDCSIVYVRTIKKRNKQPVDRDLVLNIDWDRHTRECCAAVIRAVADLYVTVTNRTTDPKGSHLDKL